MLCRFCNNYQPLGQTVFERQKFSFRKQVAILCIVYLLPVTALYFVLVMVFSNWKDQTIVLWQLAWLFLYGPPLTALWGACIFCLRRFDPDGFTPLPRSLISGLLYGLVVIVGTAVFACVKYPFDERMNPGPMFATIAVLSLPGTFVAVYFVLAHHDALRKVR